MESVNQITLHNNRVWKVVSRLNNNTLVLV